MDQKSHFGTLANDVSTRLGQITADESHCLLTFQQAGYTCTTKKVQIQYEHKQPAFPLIALTLFP